ncbi:MAG: phosphoribosylformylglycinamidine synthase subunit PurS [SAR324 cluster bacterium]|nr:phosphoribosylformylglycinamidine synthase subunit PurS [SAR324 cluster bacterium]
MIHRIELTIKPHLSDPHGQKLLQQLKALYSFPIDNVRTLSAYVFQNSANPSTVSELCQSVLADPVLHESRINQFFGDEFDFDWYVEVEYRPGVTDNVGRTAQETFEAWLGNPFAEGEHVHSLRGYFFKGKLIRSDLETITHQFLMNDLIERASIISHSEWPELRENLLSIPEVKLTNPVKVETFCFDSSASLMQFSRERTLSLNFEEAEVILDYFSQPTILEQRKAEGISEEPTDVELEILAQTWSEHCKHKIFNATVDYFNTNTGESETIHSLYKTYVKGSTARIRESMGKDDWCVSVFSDNAGIIRFNDEWNIAMKVETHNSPSALDPYGGALTGIVGVNRDIIGTGMGAEMIFNTNVFCFASPFYDQPLPPKLMHPKRIFEGVRLGVEHGGNKSGIPTVNGAIVFHERFLGKPLVFCGTGGLIPAKINGTASFQKTILPGDLIVMVGGRIGKDGIHGATFSSEALHENSPATAVQIGDPIVQRRMYDFLLEARNQGLYRCITDNGAGGLSSSVGEMAQLSNGCHLELDKAPLKYPGMQPWEIFISEAQERMTVAVPPKHLRAFLALSESMNVESTAMGMFNDSGLLKASYQNQTVAFLDMKFLHDGLPPMNLKAVWTPPDLKEPEFELPGNLTRVLHSLLGRLNICSKERVIRQYDHEVQGGSVIKPLVGVYNDGPSDAAVIRPVLESMEGLAIANGICARYSDIDTYHMMACAIDEAVRNVIAVGGSLEQIAGLDNFCWCDPVESDSNPDGSYKMAQLVRANQSLYELTTLYGVPCISGKDSMKNDYHFGEIRIAIPPTVLFTTVGKIADVRKTITMDVKSPGDRVYLLGETQDEMGASEYYDFLGYLGKNVPCVNGKQAKRRYLKVSKAISEGLLRSCHDCSDGGLAVALAESAFAGGYGMELDVAELFGKSAIRIDKLLFSESQSRFVVTVSSQNSEKFENLFTGNACYYLGDVVENPQLMIKRNGESIVNETIWDLKESWQSTLR